MKPDTTFLVSDLHLNHSNIITYCQRPENFTELILKNWKRLLRPQDTTICLGDVAIGNKKPVKDMLADIPGRKILIRGNHDKESCHWYMNNGWDFCCDAMIYKGQWLTHKPYESLPPTGCTYNIHGHLHNIWHGFKNPHEDMVDNKKLKYAWQRLFAIEYTNYCPVEFDEFLQKPDKYLARGVNSNNIGIYESLKFEKVEK